MVWAFLHWTVQPINVVSDSLYVVGIVQRIEGSLIRTVKNSLLLSILLQLIQAINQRLVPYFITHIRSHQFSDSLAQGNLQADQLVAAPM